jgi:hypothetical protein
MGTEVVPETSANFNHLKQLILSSLVSMKASDRKRVAAYFTCLVALLPSFLF